MEYLIISRCDEFILAKEVNLKIAKGFKPIGGVAIKPHDYGFDFYQAMIRKAKPDP